MIKEKSLSITHQDFPQNIIRTSLHNYFYIYIRTCFWRLKNPKFKNIFSKETRNYIRFLKLSDVIIPIFVKIEKLYPFFKISGPLISNFETKMIILVLENIYRKDTYFKEKWKIYISGSWKRMTFWYCFEGSLKLCSVLEIIWRFDT